MKFLPRRKHKYSDATEKYQLSGTAGAVAWLVRWINSFGGPWAVATIVLLLVLFSGIVTAGYYWFKLVNANTLVNTRTAETLQAMTVEMRDNRHALDGGLDKQIKLYENVDEIRQNWKEFNRERVKNNTGR